MTTLKILAFAAAALTGTAGLAATSDNYFSLMQTADANSTIDLGLVRAEGAGIVEIFELRGGEPGTLLGTEAVTAGANSDVRVSLGVPPLYDVLAVLTVNGRIVAENVININR
jgi:hypothetical protein